MAHDPISDLKRYAAALEAQVSGERSRHAARAALHTPSGRRAPRRAVVAIAATVLMGVSNVALATVADPAVPGDTLYGVDRAYERVGALVGFDTTNAGERATEVMVLQERGKSAEALALVQETLTRLIESDDPESAVEEFTEGLGNSDTVKAKVREILEVAKGVETTGFNVSEKAKTIGQSIIENLELPDNARGNPGGPADPQGPPDVTVPDGAQGNPGGPADPPGPPDDQGPDNPPSPPVTPGQGNQGNQGQNRGTP